MEDETKKELMEIELQLKEEGTIVGEPTSDQLKIAESELPFFKKPVLLNC